MKEVVNDFIEFLATIIAGLIAFFILTTGFAWLIKLCIGFWSSLF